MQYHYLKSKENYEQYAAGRVLYSIPWSAPFPVRLIDEIFQRACAILNKKDSLKLLDPCIWSWYMMTVLWFLHYQSIISIDWSDINENILEIAKKNLGLLTKKGMEQRIKELNDLASKFGKDSHKWALIDVETLKRKIADWSHIIKTDCKVWSIEKAEELFSKNKYDMIILDSPYGNLTSWAWDITIENVYTSLWDLLVSGGVLVIITDKTIKFDVIDWYKKKTITHGKRRITFIQKEF